MTTTVHLAISGNKQVLVETPAGKTRMQPGAHHTFLVHGDGVVRVQELDGSIGTPGPGPSLPLERPYAQEDGDLPLGKPADLKEEGACEACQ